MKTSKKMRFITSLLIILLLVTMMSVSTISMAAAQPPVELGTTVTNFAILAGAGITNTGSTTINGNGAGIGGDIGSNATPATTGFPPGIVSDGTIHSAIDTVTDQAKAELTTAYLDAESRNVDLHTISAALGGGQTLLPGTYRSESSIQVDGDLTLYADDPNDVFVFQAGSTLTTASSSRIILTGNAKFCRIFWQVTSSATLGEGSTFIGHIFALQSITLNAGVTVTGQLLAQNGAVTLISDFITNPVVCVTTSESGGTSSDSSGTSSNSSSTSSNSSSTSETSTDTSATSSSISAISTGTSAISSGIGFTSTGSSANLSISSTNSTGSANHKTGDSIYILLGLLVIVTITAITAFVVNKK